MMMVLLTAVPVVAKTASPKEVSVTAKEGVVRITADHMAKTVEKVGYGGKLKVKTKENDWYQVETESGAMGWIHISATTTKKINLGKDSAVSDKSSSHEEVALAGKGFNRQVEQSYISSNPAVAAAYKQVDQIEGFKVPAAQLSAFIKQGQLK
jgi:uncharacterized protein YgiM (DUF1202 family)